MTQALNGMNLRVRTGHCLISRDADDMTTASGLLHLPDREHTVSPYGFVHLHAPSTDWPDDEPLEGRRVLLEKWSWQLLELGGREFCLVDERAVLAVLEDEDA